LLGKWTESLIASSRRHGPLPGRSESPVKVTEKEATMELAMRLNVLAALLSFGFIAAIVFGVI